MANDPPQGSGASPGYPQQQPPAPRTRLSGLVIFLVSVPFLFFGAFLALWVFLEPGERKPQVSFTEFVSWVHQGQVPEIRVKGGVYSFTHVVDGKNHQMETRGPTTDGALIQDLQNNPLAKDGKFRIYFE